ncbi:MAG: hypothetical protein ACOX8W_00035 [bacterium]
MIASVLLLRRRNDAAQTSALSRAGISRAEAKYVRRKAGEGMEENKTLKLTQMTASSG